MLCTLRCDNKGITVMSYIVMITLIIIYTQIEKQLCSLQILKDDHQSQNQKGRHGKVNIMNTVKPQIDCALIVSCVVHIPKNCPH